MVTRIRQSIYLRHNQKSGTVEVKVIGPKGTEEYVALGYAIIEIRGGFRVTVNIAAGRNITYEVKEVKES